MPHLCIFLFLTLSWRRPLSYRNQSIDLLCKSMDWFLYDNSPRHERVNVTNQNILPADLLSRNFLLNPFVFSIEIGLKEKSWVFRNFSATIYLFKVNNRNTRKNVWNKFKVNNTDTRMTLLFLLLTLLT